MSAPSDVPHLRPVPTGQSTQPYAFPSKLEKSVVYWACTSVKFYNSVGSLVDAEGLALGISQLLIKHLRILVKKNSKHPQSTLAILGSIIEFRDAGKIPPEYVLKADEYLEECESGNVFDESATIEAIAPIVRRRKQSELVEQIVKLHAQQRPLDDVFQALAQVSQIGLDTKSLGMVLGPEVFEKIDKLRHIERLPLGIAELDSATGGGMGRSQLGVFLGKGGAGKSTALVNAAAAALCKGLNVGVASLELEEEPWTARLISNLTGVPTSEILKGSWQEAQTRMERLCEYNGLGKFTVRWFPPRSTKWSEVRSWFETVKEQFGTLDLLITDYADKIMPDGKHQGSYTAMDEVYEEHRLTAVKWKCWVLTASQKKSGTTGHAEIDEAADSAAKGRVADMMIDLLALEDGQELSIKVLKNRHGPSGMTVHPITPDWTCARTSSVDVHAFDPNSLANDPGSLF